MNKVLKITIVSLIGLLLIGGGVYAGYRYSNNKTVGSNSNTIKSDESLSTPEPNDNATTNVADVTTTWKTYTNTAKYEGFSIKYNPTYNLLNPVVLPGDTTTIDFSSSDTIGTGVNKTNKYHLTIKYASSDQSLDKCTSNWTDGEIFNSKIENYTVVGKDARIINNSDTALGVGKYSAVIFKNGNYVYEIIATNMGGSDIFINADFKTMLSTFNFSSSATGDIEESNVEAVVTSFEDLHILKTTDAITSMFKLYTEPQTTKDQETYNYLMGKDLPSPASRLNNSATFDYLLSSYSITKTEKTSVGYNIYVKETRSVRTSSANTNRTAIDTNRIFELVNKDNAWLIDKYYYKNNTDKEKYNGFYE